MGWTTAASPRLPHVNIARREASGAHPARRGATRPGRPNHIMLVAIVPGGILVGDNYGAVTLNSILLSYTSRMGTKPPKIMRLPSNGMLAPIAFIRGSMRIF
jgi:hypothetical protein